MPRPEPEYTARPTSDGRGREAVAIYRGRKVIAQLNFAAFGGEKLERVIEAVRDLWKESNDVRDV